LLYTNVRGFLTIYSRERELCGFIIRGSKEPGERLVERDYLARVPAIGIATREAF